MRHGADVEQGGRRGLPAAPGPCSRSCSHIVIPAGLRQARRPRRRRARRGASGRASTSCAARARTGEQASLVARRSRTTRRPSSSSRPSRAVLWRAGLLDGERPAAAPHLRPPHRHRVPRRDLARAARGAPARAGPGADRRPLLLDPGRRARRQPRLLHPRELERLLRRPGAGLDLRSAGSRGSSRSGRAGSSSTAASSARRSPRWWYMRRHRMSFLAYADTLIPSVAFGHFLGRLGCFAAGCCWGDVAHDHLPWAVRFPPESLAYQTFAARENPASFLARRPALDPAAPPGPALRVVRRALAVPHARAPRPAPEGASTARCSRPGSSATRCSGRWWSSSAADVERGVVRGLGVGQWTSIVDLRGRRGPLGHGAPAANRPGRAAA